MITPEEIKRKTFRIWNSGRFLQAWCSGENLFPMDIPFGKIGGSSISDNYADTAGAIEKLAGSSKAKTLKGYSVEYKPVSHRQLGKQNIPERIFIETAEDFLKLCGKADDFKVFKELYSKTESTLHSLTLFISNNPLVILDYKFEWLKLLDVCLYFLEHPEPSIYIRQIVIPGVNTKFIESNKKIISDLLIFLDRERYSTPFPGFAHNGFERYFGLLYDEPLIRFRILDEKYFIQGLSDITLPLSQFSGLNILAENIFITENKINGLSFPMVKNSIVIFGLGYGIQSLKDIQWIRDRRIYYWGDIDTHGFSILSMTRGIFPQCRSLLMDEQTLTAHLHCCVEEPDSKRFTGELSYLEPEEIRLFENLKGNRFGKNLRLEQELIGFDYLIEVLTDI
jgi:hypothetical protein